MPSVMSVGTAKLWRIHGSVEETTLAAEQVNSSKDVANKFSVVRYNFIYHQGPIIVGKAKERDPVVCNDGDPHRGRTSLECRRGRWKGWWHVIWEHRRIKNESSGG